MSHQAATNILQISVPDTHCVSSVFRRKKTNVNILLKIGSGMCYVARRVGNTLVAEVTWQFIQLLCWQEECKADISKWLKKSQSSLTKLSLSNLKIN